MRRRSILTLAVVALAMFAVLASGSALAAGECKGLQVCLPVEGPWVVVPANGVVNWDLRCPRRGYIVAGTDARVSDRALDVSFRAETGSPIGPGTSSTGSAFFTARYAGVRAVRSFFKPFAGCIPTSGGGSRGLTAFTPGRPLRLVVGSSRVLPGRSGVAVARCAAGSRLLDATHAVGFVGRRQPPPTLLTNVTTSQTARGLAVTVRARYAPTTDGFFPAELQVIAYCATGRAR